MTTTMQAHPVADVFPMMSDREFLDLVEDIREHGLREPIWVHRDGRVIDGRNRWLACEQVGASPESRTYEGDDAGLVEFALSLNLHRRHLNESQRGMVGARIEQYERGRPGKDANLHLKRADAAELLHVSPRSIASAKKVQESGGAELASLVDAGEIAVSAAAQIAEVVRDRTPGLEPEQVKEVVREAIHERREQVAKQRADRQALDDLATELNLPKVDERAEDARISVTHEFYRAVHALATLPPAADVAAQIPAYQHYRLTELPAAQAWLSEFVDLWKERV